MRYVRRTDSTIVSKASLTRRRQIDGNGVYARQPGERQRDHVWYPGRGDRRRLATRGRHQHAGYMEHLPGHDSASAGNRGKSDQHQFGGMQWNRFRPKRIAPTTRCPLSLSKTCCAPRTSRWLSSASGGLAAARERVVVGRNEPLLQHLLGRCWDEAPLLLHLQELASLNTTLYLRSGRYRIRTCEAFATDLQSIPAVCDVCQPTGVEAGSELGLA
jgi:hypothetical protein